jgi:CheY-like chemotaxis protein
MTNFLETNGTDSSDGHRGPLSSSGSPLVLIVEDHEDTRFMLRTLLEMRGLRVVEAEDGEAGVRAAAEIRPDLILMDGSLPRLDGLAAMRLIRERELLRSVPVVMLSGHAAPQSQAAAFAAGCSDYLVKPLDFGKLDRILQKWLTVRSVSEAAEERRVPERNMLC